MFLSFLCVNLTFLFQYTIFQYKTQYTYIVFLFCFVFLFFFTINIFNEIFTFVSGKT